MSLESRKSFVGNFSDLLLWALNSNVAHVAQSAEHILGKDEVTGSIPVMGFERKVC